MKNNIRFDSFKMNITRKKEFVTSTVNSKPYRIQSWEQRTQGIKIRTKQLDLNHLEVTSVKIHLTSNLHTGIFRILKVTKDIQTLNIYRTTFLLSWRNNNIPVFDR